MNATQPVQTGNTVNYTANSPVVSPSSPTTTPQQVGNKVIYNPVQNGGPASSTPVITSQAAQNDLAQKQDAFSTMQQNNAAQAQNIAQQNAAKQQADAQQAQQAQEQKNIDTQNQQNQQTINTKNAALLGTSTPNPTTNTPPVPTTNTTDQTGQSNPTSNPIQDALTSATNSDLSQQNDIQTQQDQLSDQVNTQLSSVLAGTFPLSVPQQALITSLQNQLAQNTASQQIANSSYVGQVSEQQFREGGEYTPTQMSGAIANAVSYGVAKIQDLDNSATQTMANLEQSFQKDDFDMINTQYDTLSKQLDSKSSEIQNMYDTVTKSFQDQRDSAATAAKNAFDETMAVNTFNQSADKNAFDQNLQTKTFNLTAAQDQNDNMFKNAQLSEQEYKDNQDLINQRTTQSIDAYNAGLISGGTFNPATGSFTQANGTAGQSPSNLPGYTLLPNGSSVIQHPNGQTFLVNGDGSLTKFQSAGDASTFTSSATAANTVNQMQTLFNKINSETSGASTSGPNSQKTQDIANYNSLLATLPTDTKNLLPTVTQATGGVFSKPQSSTAAQFTSAYSSLNQKMTGVMPSATPPVFGKTFPSGSDLTSWATQTGNTAQLTAWHNQGYSDEQILQMVNG